MYYLIGINHKEMTDRVELAKNADGVIHLFDWKCETGEGKPKHAENHDNGYGIPHYGKNAYDEDPYALTGNYI